MAKEVLMPRMGYDMDEGTLLRWLKQVGDNVERGEPIAEIETDKTNLEIESYESGVIHKLLIEEGQTVPVGQAIALVGAAGEEIAEQEVPAEKQEEPAETPASEAARPAAPQATANGAEQQPAPQVVDREPGERIRASPLVRRLAAEHDIDLRQVQGTGPGGRIVKDDVMPLVGRPAAEPAEKVEEPKAVPQPAATPAAAEARPKPAFGPDGIESEVLDLPRIRRTIGRRMSESFTQAPHFYVTASVDMGRALELRKQINAEVEDELKVSVNDLVVKAVALALRKFPMLNAAYQDGQVRLFKRIDINIAIGIEGGLMSPFIPDTDNMSLGQIAARSKDLIRRARDGKLTPEEYQGGTFTTSNLGMFDVDYFTAIINPPQAAILAVGTIQKAPVWNDEDEEFEPKDMMKVTISADHRVTDGVGAAEFLRDVKRLLEQPMLLLVS
jgi:pyruvate dehydrogenase E2 component (dihydrolipoamide acetyltransferase)